MTLTSLFNRAGQLPADNWFHLVPLGEYPHVDKAKRRRVQVIDSDAVKAMANAFRDKLLVDQDHFSYDDTKSSEAFGWVEKVEARGDGLWGQIEWTDVGKPAIANKRYRFLSPVWRSDDLQSLGDDRVRPIRLDTIGLTNSPNLKGMVPLTNRDDASASAAGQQNKTESKMKNIASKLGLTAEASEDAIIAEVTKLQNRATSAEAKVSGLETENNSLKNRVTEQDNEQIESEFDARTVEEPKRVKLRPVLAAMKNREERVEFLNDVVGEPDDDADDQEDKLQTRSGKPVLNRATAGNPRGKAKETFEDSAATAAAMQAEVESYRLANRCTYDQAFNMVRLKKPELFGIKTPA
ncbi:MAG: hypothetical protein RLZZ182_1397 [Pseudomonadota bacterium]